MHETSKQERAYNNTEKSIESLTLPYYRLSFFSFSVSSPDVLFSSGQDTICAPPSSQTTDMNNGYIVTQPVDDSLTFGKLLGTLAMDMCYFIKISTQLLPVYTYSRSIVRLLVR